MIDQSIKEQIAQRIDIVDLISEYMPLKKAGVNFKGLCPFHHEKSPSFVVSPDKQIFHCFGCQVGGDAFTFVMKHDHMTFPEALKYLADKAGIVIPEQSGARRESVESGKTIKALLHEAAEFYHRLYLNDADANEARKYVRFRGFRDDTVAAFKIGYAPRHGQVLLQYFMQKGYDREVLKTSGLFSETERGVLRDFFRDRVLFPITNGRGEVIAFGGRVMDNSLPKYINTPETVFFKKRSELYGLHLARQAIQQRSEILIVEGYCDVMRLHEAGFNHAVATLGTALTQDHARLIRRYTSNIVVTFDSDKAGVDAAMRGIDVILAEELNVRVLSVPGSKDPDEFLKENKPQAFEVLLKNHTKDFFDFRMDVLAKKYDKNTTAGLSAIAKDMLGLLTKIPNEVIRDSLLQKLSRQLNVSERSLRTELSRSSASQQQRRRMDDTEKAVTVPDRHKSWEMALVEVLVKHPALIGQYLTAGVDIADIKDQVARDLLVLLTQAYQQIGAGIDEEKAIQFVRFAASDEVKSLVSAIILNEHVIELPEFYLRDRVLEYSVQKKEQMANNLAQKIAMLGRQPAAAADEYARLCQELLTVKKELSDAKARKNVASAG